MSPDGGGAPRGLLVAVVGPSGAGKDTLIRHALARLGGTPPVFLARRVVTRPNGDANEDHDSLGEAAFARAETAGAFCLSWRAHGLCYGVPREVETRVRAGDLVLANLSRRALAGAAQRFGRLAVVEITASRDVLVARIRARGRESAHEIEQRLQRQQVLVLPPETLSFLRIDNGGPLEIGANHLAQHLAALGDPGRTAR